jgi:hypothetical protein
VWSSLAWRDFVEQGYVVAGSPATVGQRLRELAASLRVGHLMLLLHFGDMPRERAMKNTLLFAREVMPTLREIWSEWEDRWSPRPLAPDARPRPADTGSAWPGEAGPPAQVRQ